MMIESPATDYFPYASALTAVQYSQECLVMIIGSAWRVLAPPSRLHRILAILRGCVAILMRRYFDDRPTNHHGL